MINNEKSIKHSNVLILGFAFKENCPDFRNSKVIDIYNELIQFNVNVDVYDPLVDSNLVNTEFKIELRQNIDLYSYDAIILAVSHDLFKEIDFEQLNKKKVIIYDIKSIINRSYVNGRL